MGEYLDKKGTQYLWNQFKQNLDAITPVAKSYNSNQVVATLGPRIFGFSAYGVLDDSNNALTPAEGSTTSLYITHQGDSEPFASIAVQMPSKGWAGAIGAVADKLTIDVSGNVSWVNYIGKIASYNGETINTPYVSSTGVLSSGSTVYYILEQPLIETRAAVTIPAVVIGDSISFTDLEDASIMWWTEEAYAVYSNLSNRISSSGISSVEQAISDADLNTQPVGDLWWGHNYTNSPAGSSWMTVMRFGQQQMAWVYEAVTTAPYMYARSYVNDTWEPWTRLLDVRDASGFVSKSGDTMTGGLNAPWFSSKTQLPNIYGGAPASPAYSAISSSLDAAGNLFGYVEGYHGSDDYTGPNYVAVRKINGTDTFSSLLMAIGPTGDRYMGLNAGRIEANGSFQAKGDVEVNNLIDFHGGGNWSSDYTTRIVAPRNDGELWLQAANSVPMFTTYRGGSPELYAKMYADGEGGSFGWTAPDGSYNELDSWNNSHSRIYNYYGGGYHSVVWQRGKDYNLDYMHAWTHIAYWEGTGQIGWDWSDYNEFLVVILRDSNYLGTAVIQRDWLQAYTREVYTGGGMFAAGGQSGRFAAMAISRTTAQISAVTIDSAVVTSACAGSIYGRR